MRLKLRNLACAAVLMPLACSSGTAMSPDGASDGTSAGICSANVASGQPCNTLANNALQTVPQCVTETMPTGTGGTIVDGTYVLTSQTYYNVSSCTPPMTLPLRETIVISGGCFQAVFATYDDFLAGTASVSFEVQGNTVTSRLSCAASGSVASGLFDTPTQTFTATATTYTLFTSNSTAGNSNPDRVDVFTKQ